MATHWGMAIGINAYQQFQPLSYAQQDAEALRQRWIDRGLQPEHCLLLTSMSPPIEGRSTFPNLDSIQYWLQWLTEVALEPGDRLWIFFGGYGICHEGQDYWMPIDGSGAAPDSTGLSLASLYKQLKSSAIEALVLIDMNRSEGAMTEAVGNHTAELARSCGIPTMLSCMPEHYSREAMELRHGLFAAALLEGLAQDGVTSLATLDRFVADRLEELCDHYWRPLQRSWTIGDMPLWSSVQPLLPPVVLPVLPNPALDPDPIRSDEPSGSLGLEADSSRLPELVGAAIGRQGATPIVLKSLSTGASVKSAAVKSANSKSTNSKSANSKSADRRQSSAWLDGRALLWMGLAGLGLLIVAALRGGGTLESGAVVQELSVAGSGERSKVDRANPQQAATPVLKAGAANVDSPKPVSPKPASPLKFPPAQLPHRSGQAVLSFNPPPKGSPAPSAPGAIAPNSSSPAPKASSPSGAPQLESPGSGSTASGSTASGSTAFGSTATPSPSIAAPAKPNAAAPKSNSSASSPQVEAARKLLRTNQASHFNQAIAQLRQLPPGQPGYDSARQDMNRWSRTIYDLAAGRAEQGDYAGAIAAAKLVPADLDGGAAAQSSLGQWQQQAQAQARNSRDLAKAQALLQPHQASTYSDAIAIARTIPPGQPQAFEAQRLSSQWGTEIWNIAQARAQGREWSRAIAAAKLVPADSPHYGPAQAALKTWGAR
jgi:hypothetical protein